MSERVRLRRTFDNLVVLDVAPPIANASGQLIEVLPKGTGDCTTPGTNIVASVAKLCTVQPDSVPSLPGRHFVRVGQLVTCTVTSTAPGCHALSGTG